MKTNRDKLRDLELLIRSHYSVIFIDTPEEQRAHGLIKLLAGHLRIPCFSWSRTKGLVREDIDSKGPVYGTQDMKGCFYWGSRGAGKACAQKQSERNGGFHCLNSILRNYITSI